MTVPLSLYIHLPWCVKKCPYCDFNSHRGGADSERARYVAALGADLAHEAGRAGGRRVDSVFLGGGTPSLFRGEEIARVLAAVRRRFALAGDAEITLEANPGTVERDRLAAYRRAGVNRLSLGAQSFDARALARLGRIHGPGESVDAFHEARRAGFANVNIDLIYGLPAQTVAAAAADVEAALALGPEHVSCYQLTLEPNTVFHYRPPADLPDDDLAQAIESRCHGMLRAAGYARYEISAFARPGYRCRHNLNYWTFGDYLAAGAGAHGKLTLADGRVLRYQKTAHPVQWMQEAERGRDTAAARPVGDADRAFEFLLNALRLPEGFDEPIFEARTGLAFDQVRPQMDAACAEGLVERPAAGRWRPSALGLLFLNDLQARFLPPPARS